MANEALQPYLEQANLGCKIRRTLPDSGNLKD